MNVVVSNLRKNLSLLEPYPNRCFGFDERPTMDGTAFFPGGDGLWKPNVGDKPEFPLGGTLVLGSDFGDVESYDRRFELENPWRHEADGPTWRGLLKLLSLAEVEPSMLFCSNAWPCLREGESSIEGGIPGSKDAGFTARCIDFFRVTIALMKPRIIVPLGLAPTRFVVRAASGELAPWTSATWERVDAEPVLCAFGARVIPVVHPSMENSNRKHRALSLTQEADLLRSADCSDDPGIPKKGPAFI